MDRKKRFFRLMEVIINESRKNDLELFYGNDSKIVINSINDSPSKKKCLIEATLTFGNEIKEEFMDSEMAELLVLESFKHFFPEYLVATSIKFDS